MCTFVYYAGRPQIKLRIEKAGAGVSAKEVLTAAAEKYFSFPVILENSTALKDPRRLQSFKNKFCAV